MKFQEITEKEYREFWENHPLKTFLSAPEISKLRQKSNWDTYYVGVKEKKKIIAATMLSSVTSKAICSLKKKNFFDNSLEKSAIFLEFVFFRFSHYLQSW